MCEEKKAGYKRWQKKRWTDTINEDCKEMHLKFQFYEAIQTMQDREVCTVTATNAFRPNIAIRQVNPSTSAWG